MFFPRPFIEKMSKILPENEVILLQEQFDRPLRKSVRINILRGEPADVTKSLESEFFNLEKMPWYKYGFFVSLKDQEKKMSIGNTNEHFLGQIYVQEASSMLPVIALDPKEDDFILDMAAAPGSKTTQISMHMNNKGLIVANEPLIQRIKALQENIERSGCINQVITRNDGRVFRKFENIFDKVLIDAPCSGEGNFQKDLKSRHGWSQTKVYSLSKLQKDLLDSAITATKPGGTIVYSTCTLSPEENEQVVDYALQKHNVKLEKINFKGLNQSEGITEFDRFIFSKELKKSVRLWPHKSKVEGFFIAKMTKE